MPPAEKIAQPSYEDGGHGDRVVIDMGSTCTKVGHAGEDCPKFVLPSEVGVIGGVKLLQSTYGGALVVTHARGAGRRVGT